MCVLTIAYLVNTKIAERPRTEEASRRPVAIRREPSGYVAFADSIHVGGLEFHGHPVPWMDRKRAMDEDGYVGSDVFEKLWAAPTGCLVLRLVSFPVRLVPRVRRRYAF